MCCLYVFLQIAFGPVPQKSHFLFHVLFVCVSSNCLRSEKFSHKSCIFFFMYFLYVFLQHRFGPKIFFHKSCNFLFMYFLYVFFQIAFSQKKISHKSFNFFFICLLYVFLQINYGLENFHTEFALKTFPTKVAIFSSCVFFMCFLKLPLMKKNFPQKLQYFFMCFLYMFLQIGFGPVPQKLHLKIFPQKSQFLFHVMFVCVSSNSLWSGKLSRKNCNFSSCVFCMCF